MLDGELTDIEFLLLPFHHAELRIRENAIGFYSGGNKHSESVVLRRVVDCCHYFGIPRVRGEKDR